jgi:hypothetical protein
MICGTCKHWRFDSKHGPKRVGQCKNQKVLFRHCNPYANASGWQPSGVGRFEDQTCEEWEHANMS